MTALSSAPPSLQVRSYELPAALIGRSMHIICTLRTSPRLPDELERADQAAFLVGMITFRESFQYLTRESWLADEPRHRVPYGWPAFAWSSGTPVHAW